MDQKDNYWMRAASRRVSRRRVFGIAGSGALAAYLAACGGGSSNGKSTATAGGGSPTAAGASPTAKPGAIDPLAGIGALQPGKQGGKIKVGVTLETGTLDPHVPGSGGDAPYLGLFYNALVGLDKLAADTKYSLAEKWEQADPTTIIFTLRQNVKFHDGTPFDSAAVKHNVGRIQDPALKATWASQLSSIDRVETPDANTAKFVLKSPDAALLYNLGSIYGAGMVSPTAIDKLGKDFKSHPVGTGPFTFSEWVPGDHVTGKRNPNYWEKDSAGKALPYLDEVTIQPIPDDTVRYANIQTGDVQVAGLQAKDFAAADKNSDLRVVRGVPGIGVNALLHFNTAIAPLTDVNLRRALAFAIDPSVIAKNVYFDSAVQDEAGMITPDTWAYVKQPDRPKYDVAKAKQYLQAAGKPDGFNFNVIAYASPSIQQQTEVYLEHWSKVGIKAQVTTQDVSTAVKTFFGPGDQTFPLMSTSWGGTSPEPSVPSGIAYSKDAFYNPSHKAIDPRLDDMIAKAKQTYDNAQRKQLYADIEKIVLVDQCYFIPLLLSQPRYTFRKNVGNIEASYYSGFVARLQNWYLAS